MKIFTNEQIRAIEQYTIEKEGVASTELIERAASAMTAEITSRWRQDKKVWVFAGHGNNGADALVVARMLAIRWRHCFSMCSTVSAKDVPMHESACLNWATSTLWR